MPHIRTIGIMTSGGDAPGMNACTRAIVRAAMSLSWRVLGIEYGYQGLIDGRFTTMGSRDVGNIISSGGSILGAGRSKEFMTPEGFARAVEMARMHDLDAIIVQGGEGSLRGAQALHNAGIRVVGIPVSIDNDVPGSYSIGFDTALNTVLDAIRRLRDTARSHKRIVLVEVMGRDCGEIALRAGVAGGAEVILVPEHPMPIEQVAQQLQDGQKRGKQFSIVVLAEGVGRAYDIAQQLSDLTDGALKSTVTVLGHIQRGGVPSAFDILVASEMGYRAVMALSQDQTAVMVGYHKGDYSLTPLESVNTSKWTFDQELYDLSRILAQ
ncbi:MAG: ATP-dependent 6-phosphofructokinase [bacterium]|nr:ATP-dependent 6-phosphofructokinase [bacterium]